jgi:hypothetical protein
MIAVVAETNYSEVTQLLHAYAGGDRDAFDRLVPIVFLMDVRFRLRTDSKASGAWRGRRTAAPYYMCRTAAAAWICGGKD